MTTNEILLCHGEENDATQFPYWAICQKGVRRGTFVILEGIWFSRKRANDHLKARSYAYPKSAFVYCFSGHHSQHLREMYENARAESRTGRSDKTGSPGSEPRINFGSAPTDQVPFFIPISSLGLVGMDLGEAEKENNTVTCCLCHDPMPYPGGDNEHGLWVCKDCSEKQRGAKLSLRARLFDLLDSRGEELLNDEGVDPAVVSEIVGEILALVGMDGDGPRGLESTGVTS